MAPKSLSESAKSNPTALGDPVSLKAETSDTQPTDQDRPIQNGSKARRDLDTIAPSPAEGDVSKTGEEDGAKNSLKEVAERELSEGQKGNRSMLGDPVSLKAETSDKDPVGEDGMGGITGNQRRDSKL